MSIPITINGKTFYVPEDFTSLFPLLEKLSTTSSGLRILLNDGLMSSQSVLNFATDGTIALTDEGNGVLNLSVDPGLLNAIFTSLQYYTQNGQISSAGLLTLHSGGPVTWLFSPDDPDKGFTIAEILVTYFPGSNVYTGGADIHFAYDNGGPDVTDVFPAAVLQEPALGPTSYRLRPVNTSEQILLNTGIVVKCDSDFASGDGSLRIQVVYRPVTVTN